MKWFLIGSLCLVCSVTVVRGDAAADLYNTGVTAFKNAQYDDAAKAFDSMIAGYPTSANIDTARIQAGLSYLYANKYPEAVDRLAKEAAPSAKPEFRATALYFTALAQFEQGQKASDKSAANSAFTQAVSTLTSLIGVVTTAPTPDNKGYLEPAIYYRSLSNFELANYDDAEKDLVQLTTSPQFSASLSRPDYFLRLGSVYAVETNAAVTAKKDTATIEALADKSLAAFDAVSTDPNALVQANDANMSKAGVLFMIAQLDPTPAGYQKALDAFRLVRRKADMIPLQQAKLDDLHKRAQAQAQASANSGSALSGLTSDISLLIQREQGRLDELQDPKGADPIVAALIGIAECYVSMKEPDEARTVLHRLRDHATLTPDQQQTVDFQTLYSYVLGGQTDQADKALTDYLSKHGSDPNADSISYQIAASLIGRKDYDGALQQADRSLKDFPQGKYAADAIALKAQALSRLGRQPEADKVVDEFLAANPTSPVANQMFLTKAAGETSRQDFAGAAADYQKVMNNAAASPDLQASATAGYIQSLQSQQKFDDVIATAKAFEAKFPDNTKVLPSVMLFAALALDQKHDPGAVAALQDVAKKYPQDDAAPFALAFVVNIYQRANNVPAMIQAATDLRTQFPTAYTFLAQAAEAVSTALIKEKKFDDAIALYTPLLTAPKPDVAAAAQNKIGSIWLAAAKAMGYYQSMQLPTRADAEKKLSSGEQAYVTTLKTYPDQLSAVGDAFDGLIAATKQRRSWGLVKDVDMEAALAKLGADFTDHEMQTRFELAEAGLVFVTKDGAKQFPAALDRFKKAIYPNPAMKLTRQETEQFGELLLAAKDYDNALKVYTDALANAAPTDPVALATAYYGLGATALGQGDVAKAKDYFVKMKSLPGGALWNPHILDANYGIALADEGSSDAAATDEATAIYGQLMQNPQGGVALQAKAMIGYGRLLEKAGHCIVPTSAGPNEFAIHYYQEPHLLFGPAVPELSAEGLYDAGQAYEKAGNKGEAKKAYDALLKAYATTAPDWSAKATAASTALGV